MPDAFSDDAVFIDVAFVLRLAVGVSASIYRIGENVMERGVGGSNPLDGTGKSGRHDLQREQQAFRPEPEPHAARRAELRKAFEHGADGVGDGLVGMKQNFAVLFSPDEADGQTPAQLAAPRNSAP
jgi:hypothetical protein